jgi:predicted ATPase
MSTFHPSPPGKVRPGPLPTPFIRGVIATQSDIDAGVYPFSSLASVDLCKHEFQTPLTCIIGESGVGKSASLLALARGLGFNDYGGTLAMGGGQGPEGTHARYRVIRNASRPLEAYYFRGDRFLDLRRAIDQFGVAHTYGVKELSSVSHGEATFSMLLEKCNAQGLYLLDEPETGLTYTRQVAALRRIFELVNLGSQFFIVTHSPIFMACPGAQLLEFGKQGVRQVAFEETEAYCLARSLILSGPERLEEFLQSPDDID